MLAAKSPCASASGQEQTSTGRMSSPDPKDIRVDHRPMPLPKDELQVVADLEYMAVNSLG